MFNEKFWLAVAFAAFLALLYKFARGAIVKSLEDKSRSIAEEILAAKEMKEKAAHLLELSEKFAQESDAYAAKLMRDAESEAQKFLDEAKKSAEEEVAKKTAAAAERIKQEELLVISAIKNNIIASALSEVENSTLNNLSPEQTEAVFAKSIQDLK